MPSCGVLSIPCLALFSPSPHRRHPSLSLTPIPPPPLPLFLEVQTGSSVYQGVLPSSFDGHSHRNTHTQEDSCAGLSHQHPVPEQACLQPRQIFILKPLLLDRTRKKLDSPSTRVRLPLGVCLLSSLQEHLLGAGTLNFLPARTTASERQGVFLKAELSGLGLASSFCFSSRLPRVTTVFVIPVTELFILSRETTV